MKTVEDCARQLEPLAMQVCGSILVEVLELTAEDRFVHVSRFFYMTIPS